MAKTARSRAEKNVAGVFKNSPHEFLNTPLNIYKLIKLGGRREGRSQTKYGSSGKSAGTAENMTLYPSSDGCPAS